MVLKSATLWAQHYANVSVLWYSEVNCFLGRPKSNLGRVVKMPENLAVQSKVHAVL